ncbi:glycosyltransferase [Shinella sedimenti]|uniref:Glycosyltransferase n=1 Tax=Shinella sedimenti TaxID=2919913 RepID=A0ABT0CS10_9HYPH|nr:glycosyltransferase [Shinella sedimenti]MCJ8151401.1 glycosyltransferase [Shinella sedimenti]
MAEPINGEARITVVTVTLNVEDVVRATIESVKGQTYQNVTHLIIDGASEDRTVEIAREYDLEGIISEPDNGVYDAMEKGRKLAKGNYVIFLNAGDVFYDKYVCEKIVEFFSKYDVDIAYGDLLPVYFRPTDVHDHPSFVAGVAIDGSVVSNKRHIFDNSIHHQLTIYKKWILEECSYISSDRAISGEYFLLMSAVFAKGAKLGYMPHIITRFALGGISTRNFGKQAVEYNQGRAKLRTMFCPVREDISIEREDEFHVVENWRDVKAQYLQAEVKARGVVHPWLKRRIDRLKPFIKAFILKLLGGFWRRMFYWTVYSEVLRLDSRITETGRNISQVERDLVEEVRDLQRRLRDLEDKNYTK